MLSSAATRCGPIQPTARLVAAGPLVTVPGGYPMVPWGMAGLAVTSPQDAISQTKGLLDAGADLIKIAIDSGGSFGRQIPILSPAEATAIVQTAHARGARVSAHVLRTTDLARGLDAGVDDIAHMVEDALTGRAGRPHGRGRHVLDADAGAVAARGAAGQTPGD